MSCVASRWHIDAGLLCIASAPLLADTPAFDRPGIAFSPTTLPAHSFVWEQGLPDFQRDRSDGATQSAYGAGDLSLAVKVDVTPGDDKFNMAILGVVSFPTARRDMGLGSEQYSLGATARWSLGAQQSVALYANGDLLEGHATWTVSRA